MINQVKIENLETVVHHEINATQMDKGQACIALINVIVDLVDISDVAMRDGQVGTLMLRLSRELENRKPTSELIAEID